MIIKETKFGQRRTFTVSKKLGIHSDYGKTVPPGVLEVLSQINFVFLRVLSFGFKKMAF